MKVRTFRTLGMGAIAAAVSALVACGGGGGSDSSSTSVVSVGTITGFGSVIVNGVRFDDASARITLDEGAASHDDLRIGMVVEVHGQIASDGSGVAQSIEGDRCLQGPIQAMNLVQNTLTVMGQTVQVDPGTVFGGVAVQELSAFAIGDLVQVSCLIDPANDRVVSTRLEDLGAYVEGQSEVEVEGVVANLDPAAGTCTVGGMPVNFSSVGAGNRPPGFANGMRVEIKGRGMQNGVMTGERLRERERARIHVDDGADFELEGHVSGFVSISDFMVGEQKVDASAAVFRNATAADLRDGLHVEVEGTVEGDVLKASAVIVKLH